VRLEVKFCGYCLVGFALGVLTALLAVVLPRDRQTRYKQSQIHAAWEQRAPTEYRLYFQAVPSSIPIPPNIDWSTNTWRRLVYWRAFARTYAFGSPAQTSASRPLRTYGFGFEDPNWMEWGDASMGAELAERALQKAREGMSPQAVRAWVSENYQYPSPPPMSISGRLVGSHQ